MSFYRLVFGDRRIERLPRLSVRHCALERCARDAERLRAMNSEISFAERRGVEADGGDAECLRAMNSEISFAVAGHVYH